MYFKAKITRIPISFVETKNNFFRFADENSSCFSTLESSIVQLGIINPIIVQPWQKGSYRTVSGFKRLRVAKELNLASIPVLILREDLSCHDLLAVLLLSHSHSFSLTEKIRIARIMTCLGLSLSEIIKEFYSFLGIESSQLIETYLQLSKYSPDLLSYISTYGLSLKQALVFKGLSDQEQKLLIFLGNSLSLKGYDLYNILTNLKEIAIREEKKIAVIIEETGILNIEKDVKLTRSQKINKIKTIFISKRYPYLTRINKKLKNLNKKLKFSPNLQIIWDRSLEEGMKLSLDIRHLDDIGEAVENLLEKGNYDLLSQFLKVYYEGLPNRKDMGGPQSKDPSSG